MSMNYFGQKVLEFLEHNEIEAYLSTDSIKIDRDSIVNKFCDFNEEEAYEYLRMLLNEEFGERFFYSIKNDDYLWLDMISE